MYRPLGLLRKEKYMTVHQVYALISDEKVLNICVCDNYEMANHIARAAYGTSAFAVDCLQYPCAIGDSYRAGTFYRKDSVTGLETAISYVPTEEEQLAALQEELTNTQLALIELYEGGIE